MRLFAPQDIPSSRLIYLYIEYESLRYVANRAAAFKDIVRNALRDVSVRLGLNVSEALLDEATKTSLRLRFYTEALPALKILHAQGYKLLGLPIPALKTFSLPSPPSELQFPSHIPKTPAALFEQTPQVFTELYKLSRSFSPDIKPCQILVVTSSPFRIVEPAVAAGFPTALISMGDIYEPKYEIPTAEVNVDCG
jgi:hypothetical protein